MTGSWDRALAALIDRLDGTIWPDDVTAAAAVLRRVVAQDREAEGLLVEVLDVLDTRSYNSSDPGLVDFAAALVELAASLEDLTAVGGLAPSFTSSISPNGERWSP